jgi:glycosyltransferase 2 family protein
MSRQHVNLLVRLGIAFALLAWLVSSGTVDFGALDIFFDRPALLVANVAVFVGTQIIGAVRWRLFLQVAGVPLALGRAVQLTFIGTFFNVVAPGNIGGEVVKTIYVARELPPELRPRVVLIAVFDRLMALAGLVMLAVTLIAGARLASGNSHVDKATGAIAVLALVTLILPIVGIVLVRRYGDRLEGSPASTSTFANLRRRLVTAARLVSERPGALALGVLLSIGIHICSFVWFYALASAMVDQHVSVEQMATVYPLGMLSVLLPISYAGFGVGHIAFEQLFEMVGLTGGANVINVYLIGQIVLCLFGVIPYLLLKHEAGVPTSGEAELLDRATR